MTGRRLPRLTETELSGLWDAVITLEGEADDTDDPHRRRSLRAAERALRKIETSPLAPRAKAAK